jgi:hypothetical protein
LAVLGSPSDVTSHTVESWCAYHRLMPFSEARKTLVCASVRGAWYREEKSTKTPRSVTPLRSNSSHRAFLVAGSEGARIEARSWCQRDRGGGCVRVCVRVCGRLRSRGRLCGAVVWEVARGGCVGVGVGAHRALTMSPRVTPRGSGSPLALQKWETAMKGSERVEVAFA